MPTILLIQQSQVTMNERNSGVLSTPHTPISTAPLASWEFKIWMMEYPFIVAAYSEGNI